MTGFIQDLRYALKGFAKNRAFTVVALLSLTLGIGLNTAVFSIVEAFFLRAQPGRDPNRLVRLECKMPQGSCGASLIRTTKISASKAKPSRTFWRFQGAEGF
jgi:hypothetical protein